ncbi:DUF4351 domain-containing protein [Gloeomargarita lithophora]
MELLSAEQLDNLAEDILDMTTLDELNN